MSQAISLLHATVRGTRNALSARLCTSTAFPPPRGIRLKLQVEQVRAACSCTLLSPAGVCSLTWRPGQQPCSLHGAPGVCLFDQAPIRDEVRWRPRTSCSGVPAPLGWHFDSSTEQRHAHSETRCGVESPPWATEPTKQKDVCEGTARRSNRNLAASTVQPGFVSGFTLEAHKNSNWLWIGNRSFWAAEQPWVLGKPL